jgi:sirohydrochlorin cobaltochelatase
LPYNREVLEELRRRIEMRGTFKEVRIAFMQLNSPSIEETLRELAEEGIKTIVALPVFVAKGVHIIEDIPEKSKAAFEGAWEEVGKGVKLVYAEPMGADERIVDILLERAKEAQAQ